MTAERERLLEELSSIIHAAHDLSEQAGVRILVAFVPVKFRVYEGVLRDKGPVTARWSTDDLPARIEEAVRAVSPDIGFVDLTPALRQAMHAGAFPYFPDDSHWDADGHRAAAHALAQALRESAAPSGPAGSSYSRR
jgi:hypothetical protein